MKENFKKFLCVFLSLCLIAGALCFYVPVKADEVPDHEVIPVEAPVITVKKINKSTGVKISWNKCENAQGYLVMVKGFSKSYKGYVNEQYFRQVADIMDDGSKKYSYTIKGLEKGTYQFRIDAIRYNEGTNSYDFWNYGQSAEKTVKLKDTKVPDSEELEYDFSDVKLGDVITFGHYEQDADLSNGKEPIEWIVLAKSKGKMLVLSKKLLNNMPYSTTSSSDTWDKSTLRKWMNSVFYNAAFSTKEKSMILKTKLKNANGSDGSSGGKTTKDNVFLISVEDATNLKYGFSTDSDFGDLSRRAEPTEYAKLQGLYMNPTGYKSFFSPYSYGQYDCFTQDGQPTTTWWLRSQGSGSEFALRVNGNGDIYSLYKPREVGVRPALYIKDKSIKAAKKSEYTTDKQMELIETYVKALCQKDKILTDIEPFEGAEYGFKTLWTKYWIKDYYLDSPSRVGISNIDEYPLEKVLDELLEKYYPFNEEEEAKLIISYYKTWAIPLPNIKSELEKSGIDVKILNKCKNELKEVIKLFVLNFNDQYYSADSMISDLTSQSYEWIEFLTEDEIKEVVNDNYIPMSEEEIAGHIIDNAKNDQYYGYSPADIKSMLLNYNLDFKYIDNADFDWKEMLNKNIKHTFELYQALGMTITLEDAYNYFLNEELGWIDYLKEDEIKTAIDDFVKSLTIVKKEK